MLQIPAADISTTILIVVEVFAPTTQLAQVRVGRDLATVNLVPRI
jgi:hypothetical protein